MQTKTGVYETLLITTQTPLQHREEVSLTGLNAYNNGVNIINRICYELYSNSTYGTARGMTIEDVYNMLNFTPVENNATKLSELSTWEDIKSNGTYTPDGANTEEALGNYELKQYIYQIEGTTSMVDYFTGITYEITEQEYNLIFGKDVKAGFYTLASPSVYDSGEYVNFGLGVAGCDGYGHSIIFSASTILLGGYTNSGEDGGSWCFFRPVIECTDTLPRASNIGGNMITYEKCNICPHECNTNRSNGQIGRCKSTDKVKIALYSTHNFEEPCISGEYGSGTVFFSNCNLNCVYCQNYEISQLGKGREISIEELAQIFLKQQEKGVENLNLVTPTSYTMQIIEAIKIAKKNGLNIPIVYNTNGYEKIETIKLLNGYVDVYLPDFKYAQDELGVEYSKVNDYFSIATKAIQEMCRQIKTPEFNDKGVMQKGVIVRHLVLPNHIENSKKVLKWIKENLPNDTYVSVMAQYFPTYKAKNIENLNRKLTEHEWEEIEDYIDELGFENGYVQELGENEEEYVPEWD